MKVWLTLCICLWLIFAGAQQEAAAQDQKNRELVGVGLQVVPTAKGELVVLAVVEGSSAAEMGVQPGDLIIAVDGFPLHGSEFAEIVKSYLWGPVGSSARLTLLRPGQDGILQILVTRKALKELSGRTIPGVEMLEPGQLSHE